MWLELTYTFLGGLGIFFFGMKTLSEALQSIAGDLIRKIINALTSNPIAAVGVGAAVTTIVQSSSVTTVMVVGLVNASLMELSQAIGVIFGANIGTTITGWIIAIKVGKYGPLFIGLGIFPYMFSKKENLRSIGRTLIALGLVFMGLKMMGAAFKPLRSHEGFMNLLVYFSASHYFSLIACIFMGALLTCIIQSSSAMLGITIALATTGAITFQTAAALVLGENIGTTITALLASVGTNSHARRAARAHAIFNCMGVIWISPLFWQYIGIVDWLLPGDPNSLGDKENYPYMAAHIAGSHTIFNVLNTLAFFPFIKRLGKLVTWLTPAEDNEVAHLKYIKTSFARSPGLSLATAEKELSNLSALVEKMVAETKQYLLASQSEAKVSERVTKFEKITDNIQAEITSFLCQTLEGKMSREQSARSYAIIRAADELESIADYCVLLIRYRDRFSSKSPLLEEERKNLEQLFEKVYEFFQLVNNNCHFQSPTNLNEVYTLHRAIKDMQKEIWTQHKSRIEEGKIAAAQGILFADCIDAISKVSSHTVNTAEAIAEKILGE